MNQTTETIARLQKICAEVFAEVTSNLRTGMSEAEIAKHCDEAFQKQGVTEHWYDVPFNVLIGADRFVEGTTTTDYAVKAPSENVHLEEGSVLFIDFSPVDSETKLWGDWSSTIIFQPRTDIDDEQLAFLKEVRQIHRDGIAQITARSTGADVANYYLNAYKTHGITLLDVRNNTGHSMHAGPKAAAHRVWLDTDNIQSLGEGVFAVEPGGSRPKKDSSGLVVGRFEVCIYIPPEGKAIVLGE